MPPVTDLFDDEDNLNVRQHITIIIIHLNVHIHCNYCLNTLCLLGKMVVFEIMVIKMQGGAIFQVHNENWLSLVSKLYFHSSPGLDNCNRVTHQHKICRYMYHFLTGVASNAKRVMCLVQEQNTNDPSKDLKPNSLVHSLKC